jgi:hypothetical protein
VKTRFPQVIAVLCIGAWAFFGLVSTDAAAQGDEGVEYDLLAVAYICPSEPFGGESFFQYCTSWEGLTVSLVSADGTIDTTCVTASWGGCGTNVPWGSTITVSIDPAAVPEGYYLLGEPVVVFPAPDSPPNYPDIGPLFVVAPLEGTGEEAPIPETPMDESDIDGTTEGVESVSSLPDTGTQTVASGATGMASSLIGVAALMMAGAFGLRRRTG